MKKHLLILALLALAMQGCGDVCLMPGGACSGGDNYVDPANSYEQRNISWGLRLQIGDYVIDSLSPKEHVRIDSISVKIPNYKEVRYIGRVYGWDPECADSIVFRTYPEDRAAMGGVIPVDPLGYFEYSSVFKDRDTTNLKLVRGAAEFLIYPDFGTNHARRLRCNAGIETVYVSFIFFYTPIRW